MNRRPKLIGWFILLCASLAVLTWTLGEFASGPDGQGWPWNAARSLPEIVQLLGNDPIVVEPMPVRVVVEGDPKALERIAAWAADPVPGEPEPQARSRIYHAARLSSLVPGDAKWLERDQTTRIRRVKLPKQAAWHTWRGLEMGEKADGKPTEHRDQTLAALAESGVPLDAKIEAEDGAFETRDLLRTSLAEFHLGQEEISWTASAYAGYLPPQSTWRNRYGERFSFDLLAGEIMRRSLAEESCGGTHRLIALTKILRVDRAVTTLGSATRLGVVAYLRDKVAEAVASQSSEGDWPNRWSASGSILADGATTPEPTEVAKVTLVGHLLEWMHLLPEDLKPPTGTVKAATLWLASRLPSTPREAITGYFCPYTHAIASLELAVPDPTR